MNKILIAYYSRTGVTKRVAEKLQSQLGADIDEIKTVKSYAGPIGWILAGKEATQKTLAEIKETSKNLEDYDLVVIGTPVWAWNISSPVRTYLENNKGKFKKIAGFCTMGGDGAEKVFVEIEKIYGKKLVAQLALKTKEVQSNNFSEKLENFIKNI